MIHYLEAAEIAEKETERRPFDSSLYAEALRIYGCASAEVTVLLAELRRRKVLEPK